jgi:hypothetical protein
MAKIVLNETNHTVTIQDLTVNNNDFYSVMTAEPTDSHEQFVIDVIAVGTAAMQRVRSTIDVDFVEKRFNTLATVFNKELTGLELRAVETLTKRFAPNESGSYTKQVSDLIADAKRSVQEWHRELDKKTSDLLDPEKKNSGVNKLDEIVRNAAVQFHQMFNPDLRTSYASRLNEKLSQIFGTDGHAGVLQAGLQDALKPVLGELQELKSRLEVKKAAEQVVAASTLKGKPFEDLIQAELSLLAHPYGDDVRAVATGSNGSRAGDFLVVFNGIGKSAVIEARNRKQISVPSIKNELQREMSERAADLAIYVASGADMLPQCVGAFQLYDNNKIVTTIDNIHIAYRLARVLSALDAPDGSLDVANLRSVLTKIKDAAKSLRDIKSKATQVKKFAEGIGVDANGTEELIIDLIGEAEKLLLPAMPVPPTPAATQITSVA